MRDHPSIRLGGEPVTLLPQRAAWWPAARTLIVSDLHLGKERAFGALGIAVPGGVLEETLGRLAASVEQWGARRILVVGDLLHARLGATPAVIERVARWRADIAADIWLVPGNHDAAHHLIADAWRIQVCDPELTDGCFRFVHRPDHGSPDRFTWSGHIHPATRLSGGGDSVRLPCFHIGERTGILPAFSLFTGARCTDISPGDTAWAIAGERVIRGRTRSPQAPSTRAAQRQD